MLFDEPSATLPRATLRPSTFHGRGGAIAGDLDRWLTRRWEWLRPRTLPLLGAFVGLLLTLGIVKYIGLWSCEDDLALRMRAKVGNTCAMHESSRDCRKAYAERQGDPRRVRFVLEPLRPGDRYIELTLEPAAH